MSQLPMETWENIFRNTQAAGEEVEVIYLDSGDEWGLCCDEDVFEDGYSSEQEAQERLDYLEGIFIKEDIGKIQSDMCKLRSDYIRRTAPWILGGDE